MGCVHPIPGWQRPDKTVAFHAIPDATRELRVPCGQCIGCRIERAKQWSVRCMHEAQLHKYNCYVTLTYNDAHLPEHGSLRYPDFQKFLKRLRRVSGVRFSYFVAGEYGPALGRPHYHALLFGYRPPDLVPNRKNRHGHDLYVSDQLQKVWSLDGEPMGFALIGEVTPISANYVAQYCLKKVTGEPGELHYQRLDPGTGEMVQIVPEFARMSLNPAIGLNWYRKYRAELYVHDAAVLDGQKSKVPRYYDKKDRDLEGDSFEAIQYKRYLKSLDLVEGNSPDRLAAREEILKAKINLNQRQDL